MRRLFTIVIALMLSVTLTAPLFYASASTTVPACCRRSGAHHCMSMMASNPSPDTAVSAIPNRCPRLPVSATVPQPHSFVPRWAHNGGTPLFVHPAAVPQTQARYRVAYARSRQKRGPPADL